LLWRNGFHQVPFALCLSVTQSSTLLQYFKLLLQRKDDVDELYDVMIAHEELYDTGFASLSRHLPGE
jgi:hypothetical protein